MLTVTCDPNVNEAPVVACDEIKVSDQEISRRVLQIRSSWSVAERIARRRNAERRFDELLETLMCAEAA